MYLARVFRRARVFPMQAQASSIGCSCFPLRGQLSAETLLVFLVFLSIFALAFAAVSNVGAASQKKVEEELSRSSFNEFSSKLHSACRLGNGNVRVVEIKGSPATLSLEGGSLKFSTQHFSSSLNSSCGLSLLQDSPSQEFIITSIEGKIEIT